MNAEVPASPSEHTPPALEVRAVSKRFGTNLALDQVDFTLMPGEIHALLGENGAGKSTLMNVLRGLLQPLSGEILLDGRPVSFANPEAAARAGIGMVHQHFLLVPKFTVTENLALADVHARGLRLDLPSVLARADSVAGRLGWTIPMQTRVEDLPVGTQQRVEILKALLGDARVLLFDEPTAVLAPNEIAELFQVLRTLRAEGRSLVFVSHKLGEVMDLCDRVTVLRRGKNAGSVSVSDTNPTELARLMVGESEMLSIAPTTVSVSDGSPLLELRSLSTEADSASVALREITLNLHAGEILGFAGVDGNGQAELAQALTGLRPWTSGTLLFQGQALRRIRPQDLTRLGIALIPPDRHREGLALSLSVGENLMLEAAQLPRFQRGLFLNRTALRAFAEQTARDFDIRASSLEIPAASLSGGNQQKIVIARALWRKPALLVAVSPTRGLDVAATAYVHTKIRERQSEGGAVVLISTELDEVIALSTRIAVLYEGRIIGIVPSHTSREQLGLMMGGKALAGETGRSHA